MKRAFITGVGVVSSVGVGKDVLAQALLKGICGLKPIHAFKAPENRNLAGTVDEFPYLRPGRLLQMLRKAFLEALNDAKLIVPDDNNFAVLMGTMAGDSQAAEELFCDLRSYDKKTKNKISASLLKYPFSSLIDNIAYRFKLKGLRMVATNACASSNIILGYALDLIRSSATDTVIVSGAEAFKETMFWGAEGLNILGSQLKAFDKNRNGTVLGEGAGVLIIESEDKVKSRNRTSYLELTGYGISCDSDVDMIIPQADGGGCARALEEAILDAGLLKNDIHYINPHGTGTVNIDRVETLAIKKCFGEQAYSIPISSTKTILGHTGGAGGIIEAIATIIAIKEGFFPPTLNYATPDPELDLDYVPNKSRKGKINAALSINFGGGGVNSVVVFSRGNVSKNKSAENNSKKIVISGMGVISSLGNTVSNFHNNFLVRKDKIKRGSERFIKVKSYDIEQFFPNKKYHLANLAGQYVLLAAYQASKASGLMKIDPKRKGVLVGTAFGGYTTTASEICKRLKNQGPNYLTPYFMLNSGHNLGASLIAKECRVEGMYSTITTGVTAGLDAIGYAYSLIQTGRMDAMIVGGVDIVDQALVDAYEFLGCYEKNNFFLGEGAGVIILESEESAQKRRAKLYGEILSYSSVGDLVGRGKIDNKQSGLKKAVQNVLKSANLSEKDITDGFSNSLKDFIGEAHAAVGVMGVIAGLSSMNQNNNIIITSSAPGGNNSVLLLNNYKGINHD